MSYNLKTPEDVLGAIKDNKIQRIDLRFTDLPGRWRHFSTPPTAFDLQSFARGLKFDGPSIRWVENIQGNDVFVIPDPASAFLDPFSEMPTLMLTCNVQDPVSGQRCACDPRHIAQKAEAYLEASRIGDTANFGLSLEGIVFNDARNDYSANCHHNNEADAAETNCSAWRAGAGQGHMLHDAGYFPPPPLDALQAVRAEIVAILEKIGIKVDISHYEDATGNRGAIDMRFAALTRMADNLMVCKYVIKKVARQRGMTATFMPQALFANQGAGMHVHQSIWQGERPLFAGDGYAGSSALMRHYFAGLLEHAPALLAICTPGASSRFASGFEVPVNLGYLQRHHSTACCVPMHRPDPKAKRVEFLCPDPSCNPYLAFAAMLMAGIDGFDNRLYNIDPDEPIENLANAQKVAIPPPAPGSLESLDALQADHAFLLKGGVFTPDVIETYLSHKRAR